MESTSCLPELCHNLALVCTGPDYGIVSSYAATQSLNGGNGATWPGALDEVLENGSVPTRQVTTAVASREQQELAQLQHEQQALQNRLLLERSQLGSAASALQVTCLVCLSVVPVLIRS